MDLATFGFFIPACFALNMAPGPNNLLSLGNATRHGFGTACLAGAGRLLAFGGMIALASAGLAAVLHTSELLFHAIKIAGALYLFWIAWQLWRAPVDTTESAERPPASLVALARQEFLVAAQFTVLGASFLVLEVVAIAIYAWMGRHLRRWFASPKGKRVFNRTSAALLGGAGVGLLLARR